MSTRTTSVIATLAIATLVAACAGSGSASPARSADAQATPAVRASDPLPPAPANASPTEAVRPSPSALEARDPEPSLETLWTATGPAGERQWVGSPTVDPQGNIWASSPFDDAFWIVDRDGTFLESWGGEGPGDGDGQFRLAAEGNGYGDVAFGPDGGFYVADSGNGRVQQFDADRRFVRAIGSFGSGEGEFVMPLDIDTDAAGNVYVFDGGRYDVQVFDADGAFQRIAATGVGPYISVDDTGNVYAIDNRPGTLFRYRPDGSTDLAVNLRPLVAFATGLALTPSGDLLIGSSDDGGGQPVYQSLIQLDPSGRLEHVWPDGAEAVAVDPAGDRVYLTFSNVRGDIQALRLPAD